MDLRKVGPEPTSSTFAIRDTRTLYQGWTPYTWRSGPLASSRLCGRDLPTRERLPSRRTLSRKPSQICGSRNSTRVVKPGETVRHLRVKVELSGPFLISQAEN